MTVHWTTMLAAAAIALATPAAAQSASTACRTATPEAVQCGEGKGSLLIIPDTTSPSGKFAVGWRAPNDDPLAMPNVEAVENHLVRLADGKSITLVVGRYWQTPGSGRANHIDLAWAWSPDSRWVVVTDSGKWSLEAIAVYEIGANGDRVRRAGLMRPITMFARAEIARLKGKASAQKYVFDLAGQKNLSITNAGLLTVPLVFQIPKAETGEAEMELKVRVAQFGGEVIGRVVSSKWIKR